MVRKLKRRYLYFKRGHGKAPKKNAQKDLSIQEALNKMRDDWENNLRNQTIMLQYLETLRDHRLFLASKQAAADHLRLFPALRLPSVLMREFEVIAKTLFSDMKEKWNIVLPKLVDAMCEENLINMPATFDTELLTLEVLQKLHQVKVWYKERKDKQGNVLPSDTTCYLLQLFPEGTPVSEVWAKNRDPPRLMALKKRDAGVNSLFCFVDTSPLFSVNSVVEAMCLLIGTFYCFNIAWTPKAKFPLYFLVSALIGTESVIAHFANNTKFVMFLRKVGIDV